jgi:hypothetical protein
MRTTFIRSHLEDLGETVPASKRTEQKSLIESRPLEDRYKANFPFTAIGIGNTEHRRKRDCNGIIWEWIGATEPISFMRAITAVGK